MKISLNLSKPGNYAFFCPQSGVHLTLGNPIANVSGVTPAIDRGLKTKVLVKLDDTSVPEDKTETKKPVEETPKEEPKTEVKEEPVKEEPKEEAPKKRGGRPSKKSN